MPAGTRARGAASAHASGRDTGAGGRLGRRPPAAAGGRGGTGGAQRRVAVGGARGPRRARLHLKRIDPWSVMKFSFAVSLVLFVVVIVATSVLYLALDAMGVFDERQRGRLPT